MLKACVEDDDNKNLSLSAVMVQAPLQAGPSKLQADTVFGKEEMVKLKRKKHAIQDHSYTPLCSMLYGKTGLRVF